MGDIGRGSAIVSFFIVTLVLANWALAYFASSDPANTGNNGVAIIVFLSNLISITGLIAGIGRAVTGFSTGVAINGLNQYSLSRMQMAAWTILILSGLLTYAMLNILNYFGRPTGGPLDIEIPTELLEAMGIAAFTTSAVPAILKLKESQDALGNDAEAAAITRFASTTGTPAAEIDVKGVVMSRTNRDGAAWIDMLTGDEAANAGSIDISKVQQLLITLLLIGVYIGSIIAMLHGAKEALMKMPPISQTFINLLALSHAGYLAYKIAPKATPDGDTTPKKPDHPQ